MDFVTPILTPIVESLLVHVKRHLGYMVSSSNKVTDMQSKVTELESAAHDMRTRQDSNIGKSVPHRVRGWLAEVEEIKTNKETIPTGGVGCFNLKTRYKAGKDSSDIVRHIERLMKEKDEMVWTNETPPLGMVSLPRPSTSVVVHEEDQNKYRFESRYLIFNDALKSLEPNNNKTQKIALCGMGGVGKITMMEELKKTAKGKKMFDRIVKVVVGQKPNPITLQDIVADYVGGSLNEKTKYTRAERLKESFEKILKEGKKILVILDDVWEEFNLEDIGLPNPLPNGLKLLFTSRNENICNQMGVETAFIFKIDELKDEEAKKLFWGITGLGSDIDIEPDLQRIGEDILKRCGGLPIAINTIASALKVNKKKHAWNVTLNHLKKKKYDKFDPKAVFEVSYMNLKDDDLKAIFILSGLFPEDYNIDKEDLLRYGWGLNLFKKMDYTIATARDWVHTCVDTLIGLNLLIRSDREGCVKMHDLVRDFVLSNFSKVKQASIVNNDNNVSEQLREKESYERILLRCGYKFEFHEEFKHPSLALLTLMDGKLLKFSQELFTSMEKLKVMAYENMHLKFLPQYPTNLRVLSLNKCSLVDHDISFLGDLVNLEVLGLAHCRIRNLPSKIGNLKKLRLLDLTQCNYRLCIDDGVIQNLNKLEELYMEVNGDTCIRFTDANCNELKMVLNKLIALEVEFLETTQLIDVSFEKLERFRISVGCVFRKGMHDEWDYMDKYSFKNTLKLVTSINKLITCKFNELFRKTEMLHLEVKDMSYLEDILMPPPQNSFCNLKELNISNCGGLAYLFTVYVAKALIKLESLEIRTCDALKSMVNGENSEDGVITFNKLKKLCLDNLPELVSLCDPVNVMELPQLTKLELYGLPNITSIFRESNINISSKQPLLKKKVVIPKLEILSIGSMENLKEIWPCEITSREEEVNKRCGSVEINAMSNEEISKVAENMSVFAFPSNFHHLRRIEFERFEGVEVMFEIESLSNRDQLVINEQQPLPLPLLPNLEHLRLKEMDTLTHVWKCNNWNKFFILHKHQPQSFSFQNLTTIHVSNCKSIKYLFSPLMVKLFSNLKAVIIMSCEGMKEVVSNQDDEYEDDEMTTISLFPHLELLKLSLMDNLKHIGGGVTKDATNVSHAQSKLSHWSLCQYSTTIHIFGCHGLSSVIPSYATGQMQKLQELNIHRCDAMEEVFETVTIPRPTNSIHVHKLPNLKKLEISRCNHLKYIFTFSTLESLKTLEDLTIRDCEAMRVIIREEYGEGTMTSSKDMNIIFPNLKSIKLGGLTNLEGFFLGMNIDFQWPILDYVMISDCPQMMMFTSGWSTTPRLKNIYTKHGKHNLECGINFHVTPSLHQWIKLSPITREGRVEFGWVTSDIMFRSNLGLDQNGHF